MGKLLKCCQTGLFLSPKKRSFFSFGGMFDSCKVYTSTYILWETYNTTALLLFSQFLISTLIKTNKKQNYEQIFADHILANAICVNCT